MDKTKINMDQSCFSGGDIAGAVFGTLFAAIILLTVTYFMYIMYINKKRRGKFNGYITFISNISIYFFLISYSKICTVVFSILTWLQKRAVNPAFPIQ